MRCIIDREGSERPKCKRKISRNKRNEEKEEKEGRKRYGSHFFCVHSLSEKRGNGGRREGEWEEEIALNSCMAMAMPYCQRVKTVQRQ